MSRFSRDVRDMLHRRALDIPGADLRAEPPRRAGARRLAVGAAASISVGTLAWLLVPETDDQVDVSTEPAPVTTSVPTTTVIEPSPDSTPDDDNRGAPPTPPANWRALLPDGFVPETALSIFREDPAAGSAERARPATVTSTVEAYLTDRAPRLASALGDESTVYTTLEESGRLSAVHYAAPVDDRWEHGVVVVRIEFDAHYSVIAAVSASVDIADVRRQPDRVVGVVASSSLDLLAADVLDVDGTPVPGAPHPEGRTGVEPVFGTAGTAQPDPSEEPTAALQLDVVLDPGDARPVVVLLRHVGGTWLSITEFALRPTTYASRCEGARTPVDITFGPWFHTHAGGPLPGSQWPLVDNQSRSHVIGEHASIEVFWPPSPEWVPTIMRATSDDPQGVSSYFAAGETALLGTGNDPCDYVQLALTGDPVIVERWTSALSAMYSFGVPPSLADFGPEQMLAEADAPADGPPGELVIATEEAGPDLPTVPPSGSCDGSPDAPPRFGNEPGSWASSPAAALGELLTLQMSQVEEGQLDLVLPNAGYVELTRSGEVVAYVLRGGDSVMGVIEVETDAGRWRTTRWQGSAC